MAQGDGVMSVRLYMELDDKLVEIDPSQCGPTFRLALRELGARGIGRMVKKAAEQSQPDPAPVTPKTVKLAEPQPPLAKQGI
jgi:hypothetical protein